MTLLALLLLLPAGGELAAQHPDLVIRGGLLFDAVADASVPNPGILVRSGRIQRLGVPDTEVVPGALELRLGAAETVLPGFIDLHAHHAVDLFGQGRIDETVAYPAIFLANGVTTTFPAGEMQPEAMRALRLRVERGEQAGPRLFNSGPYFGTARPGWRQDMTAEQIHAEVDHWVEQGARGFKAKGIRPEHLQALIERAHRHGLTVTGHLESGFRNSVNPRDAILMGIDRIEHFLGGDAFVGSRTAYASFEEFESGTAEFERIAKLFIDHNVYFDATISAYGYYGLKDPDVFTQWTDETRFFTPYAREIIARRPERQVMAQFERIYWIKRDEVGAFYRAGGGHLITVGTDHPSWGEFVSGYSIHREIHSLVNAGLPPAAALKAATINGARALGVGDRLGTIEVGKWADMVIVGGDPLQDIRATRGVLHVVKAGAVYDPAALLRSAEGRIGPANESEARAWGLRLSDEAMRDERDDATEAA
jgi:imidazolonepropionase-like amidohydrolase